MGAEREEFKFSHLVGYLRQANYLCMCFFVARFVRMLLTQIGQVSPNMESRLSLAGTSGGTIAMSYGTVDILCVDTPSSASPASSSAPTSAAASSASTSPASSPHGSFPALPAPQTPAEALATSRLFCCI